MLEEGLNTRLRAQVTSVANRVYPERLPQNPTYPALTYRAIVDPKGYDHGGPDGTVEARVQITTRSTSYGEMREVDEEVNAALDDFTGSMGGVAVAAVFNQGGPDLVDHEVKPEVHFKPRDFLFQYAE